MMQDSQLISDFSDLWNCLQFSLLICEKAYVSVWSVPVWRRPPRSSHLSSEQEGRKRSINVICVWAGAIRPGRASEHDWGSCCCREWAHSFIKTAVEKPGRGLNLILGCRRMSLIAGLLGRASPPCGNPAPAATASSPHGLLIHCPISVFFFSRSLISLILSLGRSAPLLHHPDYTPLLWYGVCSSYFSFSFSVFTTHSLILFYCHCKSLSGSYV